MLKTFEVIEKNLRNSFSTIETRSKLTAHALDSVKSLLNCEDWLAQTIVCFLANGRVYFDKDKLKIIGNMDAHNITIREFKRMGFRFKLTNNPEIVLTSNRSVSLFEY